MDSNITTLKLTLDKDYEDDITYALGNIIRQIKGVKSVEVTSVKENYEFFGEVINEQKLLEDK